MHRSIATYLATLPVAIAALTLLLLADASSTAEAATFSLQCNENERISRVVVRTGQSSRLQFIGVDCRQANGARRIFKAGIEQGTRHEILTPKDISEIRYAKGACQGDNSPSFAQVCSIAFRFADGSGTSEFGSALLSGGRHSLNGNGEVYGIAGDFRRGNSDARSGFTDLKIVTRKLDARNDSTYDVDGVLGDIQRAMRGAMGYASVVRNPAGDRIGFVRAGWAIHPHDSNLSAHAGQFDVHTKAAVGSTTKAWASAVAALRADEFTNADTLGTPFQNYLPRRWRSEVHSRFRNMTVLDVIRHQAGFRFSGNGQPARDRLRTGDVPFDRCPLSATPPYPFCYTNTAGGLFHFILPHMMLASVSGAPAMEDSLTGLSDAAYDEQITHFTGTFYEDFVQKHILSPVGAIANCNTRDFLGKHQVAAAYSDQSDRTGVLPASSIGHCASGGWVISVNDLSRVMSALSGSDQILNSQSRSRLFDPGPNRVWQIMVGSVHTHNGLHDNMRAVVARTRDGYVAALAYNSPPGTPLGSNQRMLVNAFANNVR